MAGLGMDAALSAKQAQTSELVDLKRKMDALKDTITPRESKEKKLRKACTDFEAIFLNKLWQQMRATIPKDSMFDTEETEMYRSIFDHDFAERMAQDGGIGLGDMLYDQLKARLKDVKTTKASDSGAAGAGSSAQGAMRRTPQTAKAGSRAGDTRVSDAGAPSAFPLADPDAVGTGVDARAKRVVADRDRRQATLQYGFSGGVSGRKLAVEG